MTAAPLSVDVGRGREPSLWMLIVHVAAVELLVALVLAPAALLGGVTALFPIDHGSGSRLSGWPYAFDGPWSVVADLVIVISVTIVAAELAAASLRVAGLAVDERWCVAAFALLPTGLPLALRPRHWPLLLLVPALFLLRQAVAGHDRRLLPTGRLSLALAAVPVLVVAVAYGPLHPIAPGGASTATWWNREQHRVAELAWIDNEGLLGLTLVGIEGIGRGPSVTAFAGWAAPRSQMEPLRALRVPAHATEG